MRILPETTSGRWSISMFVFMIALFVMGKLYLNSPGIEPPAEETTGINWPVVPGFIAGAISSFLSVFAIIRDRERSLIVLLVPVILLLLVYFGTQDT